MNPNLSSGTRTQSEDAQEAETPLRIGSKVYFSGTVVRAQADLEGALVWVRPTDVDPACTEHDQTLNAAFVENAVSASGIDDKAIQEAIRLYAEQHKVPVKTPADVVKCIVSICSQWVRNQRLSKHKQLVKEVEIKAKEANEYLKSFAFDCGSDCGSDGAKVPHE